jgi:hypothetical protein
MELGFFLGPPDSRPGGLHSPRCACSLVPDHRVGRFAVALFAGIQLAWGIRNPGLPWIWCCGRISIEGEAGFLASGRV